MKCSQCGTENEDSDRYCEQCGSPLQAGDSRDLVSNGQSASSNSVAPSTLVRLDGAHQESYSLGTRAVIGRLDTCDLPVDDRSVSREHARLSRLRDGYVVEDLGSTNGTLVNGRRIDEAVILRPGDILTIGSIEFRFQQQPAQSENRQPQVSSAWSPMFGVRQGAETSASASPVVASDRSDATVSKRKNTAREVIGALDESVSGAPDVEAASVPADAAGPQFSSVDATEGDRLSAGTDGAADSPSPDMTDAHAALEMTDRLRTLVRGLVNELEAAQQRLETDRELLDHSRAQLQDAQNQLEEIAAVRDAALEDATAARAHGTMREDIRAALENSLPTAMSAPDAESLHALLDSLIENPRDIGVLMNIAEQAAAIREVVDVAGHQRQVLDRIRELVQSQ